MGPDTCSDCFESAVSGTGGKRGLRSAVGRTHSDIRATPEGRDPGPQHQVLAPQPSEVIELDDPGREGLFPGTVYQLNLDGDFPLIQQSSVRRDRDSTPEPIS